MIMIHQVTHSSDQASNKHTFWIIIIDEIRKSRKTLLCLLRHSAVNGCPLAMNSPMQPRCAHIQPGGSEELTNNCNFHVGSFDATELIMNEKLNLHRSISYQYPYICSMCDVWCACDCDVSSSWWKFKIFVPIVTTLQPFKPLFCYNIFIATFIYKKKILWHSTHIFHFSAIKAWKHRDKWISDCAVRTLTWAISQQEMAEGKPHSNSANPTKVDDNETLMSSADPDEQDDKRKLDVV